MKLPKSVAKMFLTKLLEAEIGKIQDLVDKGNIDENREISFQIELADGIKPCFKVSIENLMHGDLDEIVEGLLKELGVEERDPEALVEILDGDLDEQEVRRREIIEQIKNKVRKH